MTTITEQVNRDQSVLKILRSLMPARVLTYHEALQRAELQASRLLALHQITEAAVPIEIVTDQPCIRLKRSYDLPASGSAHWNGTDWVITLNAAEYEPRQRFSLLHEYKHIIDHPTRHLIHGDGRAKMTAGQMAEKVADYFAACVLMPKSWVKTAFCSETQSIEQLATKFHVSPKAMSYRISQLGLIEPADRCSRNNPQPPSSTRTWPSQRRYLRAFSTTRSRPHTGVLT